MDDIGQIQDCPPIRDPLAAPREMTVVIDATGLVRLQWAPGMNITVTLARAAAAEVNRICAGSRYPMLVDMTDTESVTREARTVFTEPSAASKIALLGTSAVDRVIANFILGVSKVPVPIRFFATEADALAWLRAADRARGG